MLNKAITNYIGDSRLSPILLENYKYDSNNNLIEQSINNQKYNFFYKNNFNEILDYISFDSLNFIIYLMSIIDILIKRFITIISINLLTKSIIFL